MPFEKGNTLGKPRATKKLFKEFHSDGIESIYDWHDRFIEIGDITEYKAALDLVGSWEEWLRFKRDWPGFNKILDNWLEELEVKIRSEAVEEVIKKSPEESSAAKWLAEGKYAPKYQDKRTKAAQDKEKRIQKKTSEIVDDEVSRVINFVEYSK